MKNGKILGILILAVMGGPWGCTQMSVPLSPASKTNTVQNPSISPTPVSTAAPSFVKDWRNADSQPLSDPQGIVIDQNQDVYVTDADLDEVLKYDGDGNLLGHWGNTGDVTLDQPSGIAVKNGNIYVADSANYRIVEYDPNGNVLALLQPLDGDYFLFVYPTGVSFDQAGNLYVSDNSDTVYQFDGSLTLKNQWTAGNSLDFPMNSTEDSTGNVYVANYDANNIVKFNPTLNTVSAWGQTGSSAGQLSGPSDVKLDPNGNVDVVDSDNGRIEVFTTVGAFISQWGQDSVTGNNLSYPNSLAFDSNGNAYVVDSGNSRIAKYSYK